MPRNDGPGSWGRALASWNMSMVHQRMLVRVTCRAAIGARFGTGLGGSELSLYMTARSAMRIKRTYDEIA
jgi:hypothetical protein